MTCDFCDKGWVSVGTSGVGTDQMAPCPHCPAGKALEARLYPNGYWQGREVVLPPIPEYRPLPRAENARRLKELMERFARQAAQAREEREKPKPSLDDMLAESEAA